MSHSLDFLLDLLKCPTAPFREKAPRDFAMKFLGELKIPCFVDKVGNLIVGVKNSQSLVSRLRSRSTWFLMAHLDHPGFHAEFQKPVFAGEWLGGIPENPTGALCYGMLGNERLPLKLEKFETVDGKKKITLSLQKKIEIPEGSKIYGGFDFKEWAWKEGDIIWTKAADDLVGVGAILEVFRRDRKSKVVGILTRGEEVGFIGLLGHLESYRPTHPLFLSLETSRQLPGAEIGKGPIVRLGDRKNIFDPMLVQHLAAVASKNKLIFQKRVMDGGTCEATATTVYGLRSCGISIPLGNYHNQPFETKRVPAAPEFVHRGDVEGMVELILKLGKKEPSWLDQKTDLQKHFRSYRPFLKSI